MSNDNIVHPETVVHESPVAVKSDSLGAVEAFDTSVESPAPAAMENGSGDEGSATTERRVRLSPTVDPSQLKPIPSIAPPSDESARSAAPVADGAANPPAKAEPVATAPKKHEEPNSHEEERRARQEERAKPTEPAPVPQRSGPPVEIPPVVKELDSQMEAEIEAAMASGELDPMHGIPSRSIEAAVSEGEEKPAEEALETGHHLTGRIQSIHADSVFLDLGYRSPGCVSLRQFTSGKKPEVGQRIEVVVERISQEEGLIYLNLPRGLRRIAGNWEALAKGQTVECIVNRTNKGGLEVTVGGLRGFLPSSQVDLGFVSDLNPFVGQKLRVEVMEVNPKKRNLVVSRRACLLVERKEAEEKLWQTLDVDQTFNARVKTIKDYGAFVDLGGVDGFLHIGEISWHRLKHPSELLKEGQTIDVKVLSLDREKKKIGLGMKQLVQNPWTTVGEKYPANSTVTGKITRIADFGAFVELEPGLEGLVHVSELDHKHVRRTGDVVKVHQVVTAQVLEVDVERKRVSLSLKALIAKPEEPKPVEEPKPAEIQRKHKGPLKGGTGTGRPGGLFGNPSDFR